MEFHPGRIATDEVGFARHGVLGRIRLHRPKAINALTHAMIAAMLAQLDDWASDASVRAVVIDGEGERGLCAGGDVRQLREAILHEVGDPESFWDDEYRLNAAIADYPKPFVAIMDGVVMGGGVGISAYGSLRLTTPRSKVAMPETAIGFFPDVGGLHPMSRAPGELGTHAALTGLPMTGADAVLCGLADTVVEPADIESIIDALAAGTPPAELALPVPPPAELEAERDWIDACYRGEDAVAIVAALRGRPEPAARRAAEVIASRSPLSVAVTLAAIRKAATMSLAEVLDQDRRLGRHFVTEPDFVEGVRAVLVDRDDNPRWRHDGLADVTADEVARMFT
ncbi:enoyl-CoA hydratase/isomerase family protein [Stackebrandtia nassauensis]|uniref:3-hydroxyisobutyryl-CoA hydrolase n=1 Tax=Stackebrandtia nassauensis (strain DSM 44728 / CIP 108903 / NRRL B-16338 / NBRC 102104 / LLR-40K-21) TaxID=446470 RepID=D3PW51_STANL|nr:enoyl-CoA hydratase/isomerase family protein [Stackebrandtia nassauensis]ADD41208.1 Enoyl-CoA hydratase/isomerase [Stackebrandtia nassauensis DSM 44728]